MVTIAIASRIELCPRLDVEEGKKGQRRAAGRGGAYATRSKTQPSQHRVARDGWFPYLVKYCPRYGPGEPSCPLSNIESSSTVEYGVCLALLAIVSRRLALTSILWLWVECNLKVPSKKRMSEAVVPAVVRSIGGGMAPPLLVCHRSGVFVHNLYIIHPRGAKCWGRGCDACRTGTVRRQSASQQTFPRSD